MRKTLWVVAVLGVLACVVHGIAWLFPMEPRQWTLVIPLALAAAAAGADGLMVEAHPCPSEALCDAEQALTSGDLERLCAALEPLARAQGRTL